eukprot:CAMPEP_0178455134 /NCGR_PEP_ID=MMETSP0689_2-20121128/45739_1 /TAXON_ID=160604 /ORGANISM="Amphidinium massartii, Strain CS-259" /LENGTH=37 /DNA_ID= /DNA_START= /DNA_END= /DNA_ORIENTATION=
MSNAAGLKELGSGRDRLSFNVSSSLPSGGAMLMCPPM